MGDGKAAMIQKTAYSASEVLALLASVLAPGSDTTETLPSAKVNCAAEGGISRAEIEENARKLEEEFPGCLEAKNQTKMMVWLFCQPEAIRDAAHKNAGAIVDYDAARMVMLRFHGHGRRRP